MDSLLPRRSCLKSAIDMTGWEQKGSYSYSQSATSTGSPTPGQALGFARLEFLHNLYQLIMLTEQSKLTV